MFFHRTKAAVTGATTRSVAQRAMSGVHVAYALVAAAFVAATLWEGAKWLWARYSYLDVAWTFAWASAGYVAVLAIHGLVQLFLRMARAARDAAERRRAAGRPSLLKRAGRGMAWIALLPVRGALSVGRGGLWALALAGRGAWVGVRFAGDVAAWPFAAGARFSKKISAASKARGQAKAQEKSQRAAQAAIEAQARWQRQERERSAKVAEIAAAQAQAQRERDERAKIDAEKARVLAAELAQEKARRAAAAGARKAAVRGVFSKIAGAVTGFLRGVAGVALRTARAVPGAVASLPRTAPSWSGWAFAVALAAAAGSYDLYVLKLAPLSVLQSSVGAAIALGIVALMARPAGFVRWKWFSIKGLAGAAFAAALAFAWHYGATLSLLSDRNHRAVTAVLWAALVFSVGFYSLLCTDLFSFAARKLRRAALTAWGALTRSQFSRERIRLSPWARRNRILSTRGWIYAWIVGYATLASVLIGLFVFRQPAAEAAPRLPAVAPSTGASVAVQPAAATKTEPETVPEKPLPAAVVITRYLGCDPTGKICDNGPEVESLQRILKDAGFYAGAVDGAYSKTGVGAALDAFLQVKAPGRDWSKHRLHGLLAVDQYRAMQKLYPDLFKASSVAPARR